MGSCTVFLRHARSSVPILAVALLLGLVGCQEDAESPTAPGSDAALVTGAATAGVLWFRQITAGSFHTCGVTTDDRAYCWGQNSSGELGDGTGTSSSTPVVVAGGLRFVQVSAGSYYTCGLTTDDRAYCWGENISGKLGDGTAINRLSPAAVRGGHRFRQVDAGGSHSCGVTTANEALCWGYNRYGQLGDGSTFHRRQRPVLVAGGHHFIRVTAGLIHTCGLTLAHRAYCWGNGDDGRIGDGKTFQRRTPTRVVGAGAFNVRQLVAGGSHSCSVTTDDMAFCWGNNTFGQIGDGSTTNRVASTAVTGGIGFSGVSPGEDHTCGVTPGSLAYCWGRGYYGQLGNGLNGDDANRLTPTAVTGDLYFNTVSSGRTHTCGVTTGGRAYCWGGNTAGQLGNGTTSFSRPEPVAVVGPM